MSQNCLFCKIVSGETPSVNVYEDNHTLAFLDLYPISKGHTLIIPKQHFENLEELPKKSFIHIFNTAQKISYALRKSIGAEGINLLQNNGLAAGQEIFHFHLHIIPRFNSDNHSWEWNKKCYDSNNEMSELANKMKAKI